MNTLASMTAIISVIALGAFWSTLKSHFEPYFAKRFVLPAFFIAVADCFVISQLIGWWTILLYPALQFLGAGITGKFTSGKYLKTVVIDGGIWLVGLLAAIFAAIANIFLIFY